MPLMLSIQIAKFKSCQYQLRAISQNLILTKIARYTVGREKASLKTAFLVYIIMIL